MSNSSSVSQNEKQRLLAIKSLDILDTPPEQAFDEITRIAAAICGTSIAMISLMAEERQWFKSAFGVVIKETSRDLSFCKYTVEDKKLFQISDIQLDSRFKNHPFVTGEPQLRFYCGAPLVDDAGQCLGTLCVLDREPRQLTTLQTDALETLSRQVVAQMQLRVQMANREKAYARLRAQDELLRSIFETSSFMMGLVEIQGSQIIHLSGNAATAAYLKKDAADISSVNASEFGSSKEELDLWIKKYEESRLKLEPVQFLLESKKGGKSAWIQCTVNYLPAASSKHSRYTYIAEEVTKRMQQEALIREQQKHLIQSSKMASLGGMAAGLAHEINNPLAILNGYSDRLRRLLSQEKLNPKELIESLDSVDSTVDRISKVVRGLSAFARGGEGDCLLPAKLSIIVDETLDLCVDRLRKKNITCRKEISSEILIDCRAVEISQVLLNLINNSCDAIDAQKERWIEIVASVSEDVIVLTLTDSGPGIPSHVVDRLFEPFFTTKSVGKGMGLGLSIAHGLIEAHHGQIRVDANCANTRFEIQLPRSKTGPMTKIASP